MLRLLVLALLTAVSALTTPATIGYFSWQHQDSGVGWFTVGVLTNHPDNPTTSNVRLDDVRLIISTDVGGVFEYLLTLGMSRPSTSPVQEPGIKWPGGHGQTLVAQTDSALEYRSREFNPLAGCSSWAQCAADNPDGDKSTDKIVQARLEYRAVLLDPLWYVNTYPGTSEFYREFDDSHVYSVALGDGSTPFLYSGPPESSYVSVDLTVPEQVSPEQGVPEASPAILVLSGLAVVVIGSPKSIRRQIEKGGRTSLI